MWSRSLLTATSSSRFVVPNFWRDPNTGIGYQVQVQVPPPQMTTAGDVARVPVKRNGTTPMLVRDVADVKPGTMPGEFDRYNMRRLVSLTANIEGADLGRVADQVDAAIRQAGEPPTGVEVAVRGQIEPMRQMFRGLEHRALARGGRDPAALDRVLPVDAAGARGAGDGAGRRRRRRAGAVGHPHDAQHPVVHGRDHGDRRGRRQRDSARDLRRAHRAGTAAMPATPPSMPLAAGRGRS